MSNLQSFLTWEIPSSAQVADKTPGCWLTRKKNEKTGNYENYRLIFNQAFIADAYPSIIAQNKGKAIGWAGVNLDKKNKTMNIVFDVPDDVPRYKMRNSYQASYATHLANKMLLSDVWEVLFKFPPSVEKQFLSFSKGDLVEEEDGTKYQVWKLKYNPKEDRNARLIVNSQAKEKKALKA